MRKVKSAVKIKQNGDYDAQNFQSIHFTHVETFHLIHYNFVLQVAPEDQTINYESQQDLSSGDH